MTYQKNKKELIESIVEAHKPDQTPYTRVEWIYKGEHRVVEFADNGLSSYVYPETHNVVAKWFVFGMLAGLAIVLVISLFGL